VDLNFAMLQTAQRLLRAGRLAYDRRRIGLVYDRRDFPVTVPSAEDVDFWACDVLALPFASSRFGTVLALNVLDCVSSPLDLLLEIRRLLKSGGDAVLSTPYDWSPAATPVENWIGGHSQRVDVGGFGATRLRALLASVSQPDGGLELLGEAADVSWLARLHSRSTVTYRNHVFAVRA
jgi:SAM-dependent methyltransferase